MRGLRAGPRVQPGVLLFILKLISVAILDQDHGRSPSTVHTSVPRSSDSESTPENRSGHHAMGMCTKLPQETLERAMTFLTSRSVRLSSWTCRAVKHIIDTTDCFVCASGVASESRPIDHAAPQMAAAFARCRPDVLDDLPRLVEAEEVLGLLRDTKVRTSAQQLILHLDVPTICTEALRGAAACSDPLALHAGTDERGRCWQRSLAGLALGSVSKLHVFVTEPTTRNDATPGPLAALTYGYPAACSLAAWLRWLWGHCGASTGAAISAFPHLMSLNIDVSLSQLPALDFWNAMGLSLGPLHGRHVTDLRLHDEDLLKGGYSLRDEQLTARKILALAKRFPRLEATSLSSHPVVVRMWRLWKVTRTP